MRPNVLPDIEGQLELAAAERRRWSIFGEKAREILPCGNRRRKPLIRKATMQNIDAVEQIYDAVHDAEESGALCIGWDRSVYPVRQTALAALAREDEVMVLHTLVVDPHCGGRDYGTAFVAFYEEYARAYSRLRVPAHGYAGDQPGRAAAVRRFGLSGAGPRALCVQRYS